MTGSPPPNLKLTATATILLPLLLLLNNMQMAQSDEQEQSWVDKTKETTKNEIAAMFGKGKNSTTFIVVCAALGVILLIFILAIALCCSRRKKRKIARMKKKRNESILPTTTTTTSATLKNAAVVPAKKAAAPPPTKVPNKSAATAVFRGGGVGTNHPPIPITRPLPPPQSQPPPTQSYFGTIQSTADDMDDVSTLGDPFMVMGGDVNARMDADNTVGESMISSQQQLFIYGVGRQRSNTGNESRMDGGTTVFSGSKNMLFGEDSTLEQIYEDNDVDGISSSDELITVIAPRGPLGIVLDNPHGAVPVVYAVKETSSLLGKIRVGDLLLSVDEVDCRGMTSQSVSKFLNSRSQNVGRKMILSRSLGIVTGEAV